MTTPEGINRETEPLVSRLINYLLNYLDEAMDTGEEPIQNICMASDSLIKLKNELSGRDKSDKEKEIEKLRRTLYPVGD